jgi:hypothetical protein
VGALAAVALAGCATAVPVAPAPPPGHFTPTACERSVLVTGQAPDLTSPQAVAENLRWGALAPETCPEAGRLDEGSPSGGRR